MIAICRQPAVQALNSRVGVARIHPNATVINGHFSYDMPKAIAWQPLPAVRDWQAKEKG